MARRWLTVGSTTAFVAAAVALIAAVAGGITEPTGVLTIVAVAATVVAYGLLPLVLSIAMRQSGLSSWWAVAAALLAAVMWCSAGVLYALPTLYESAPAFFDAFVGSAPNASALWLVVASVEVVRAGMHRWSLVFVSAFLAVLIVGSLFIDVSGFDIRKVLVPLGWAIWMVDVGGAQRARMAPPRAAAPAALEPPCANCGAPRRTDGLAFCADCGLPYGAGKA